MIHRLALLMGGAGAAGALALALTLNGSASPTAQDAFVPVANDVTAGDQLAQVAPIGPPAQVADPGADQTALSVTKQVDTIYVLPAPKPVVVHADRPAGNKDNQPSDTPGPPRNDGGGGVAGDDGQGDESDDSADNQAGGQEAHDGGDQSHDGGSGDGGHAPGDD